MKVVRHKPTPQQIKAIKARHGHPSGEGLNITHIRTNNKVHVKKPDFIRHNKSLIARGFHPKTGERVAQIVHHIS